MSRPNEQEVEEALASLLEIVRTRPAPVAMAGARAIGVLREAVRPRRALPAKDFADMLGVDSSNLNEKSVAGLPAPAYTLPRPTKTHPDRVARFWWEDEADACARRMWARREREKGQREGGA